MNNRNTTLLALSALPKSQQPLMKIDAIQPLLCQPLESICIQSVLNSNLDETQGEQFAHPIQIVVLGIHDNQVNLGIYCQPDWLIKQGPPPNEQWWQQYKAIFGHPYTKVKPVSGVDTKNTDSEKRFILNTRDTLYDLQAAYQFFGTTVKAALQTEEYIDMPRKTQHGYAIVLDWILDQGDNLLKSLDQRLGQKTGVSSIRRIDDD